MLDYLYETLCIDFKSRSWHGRSVFNEARVNEAFQICWLSHASEGAAVMYPPYLYVVVPRLTVLVQ